MYMRKPYIRAHQLTCGTFLSAGCWERNGKGSLVKGMKCELGIWAGSQTSSTGQVL